MPKPMINLQNETKTASADQLLSLTPQKKEKIRTDTLSRTELERLLRKPRSKQYINAINKLDAGGHVRNAEQVQDIVNAIKEEFPEVALSCIPVGIVSKCYLGAPYEVHTLDISGDIIEHYEKGHAMPELLEKARGIAIYGGYQFVEVYHDCLRAVSSNGTVSVIK